MKNLMKLDLQHFAEPAGGTEPPAGGQQQTQTPPAQQTQELAIDYEKLAQIVQGKQSVAEDSALRGYLKQQGLSKEQMDQAIATYKQQQAANQPDVGALQTQAAQAQAATQQAQIQAAATIAAVGLGIDAKTIPYVLKMADLSQVMGEDGEINDEALKTALNKVLEDVPAAPAGQAGFVQVGASGGSSQQQTTDDALKKAFGL